MICLENVLKISLQDVLKTSWRCLEDVLKTSWRRLENVVKTSGKRLQEVLPRRLEDVWPRRIYWSWPRRLEDLLRTSSEDVSLSQTYSSWSRRLEDAFKTPSEDEDEGSLQDVFKTSSSRRIFAGTFHLVKPVSFSGRRPFKSKLILLLEAIPFSRSYFF